MLGERHSDERTQERRQRCDREHFNVTVFSNDDCQQGEGNGGKEGQKIPEPGPSGGRPQHDNNPRQRNCAEGRSRGHPHAMAAVTNGRAARMVVALATLVL